MGAFFRGRTLSKKGTLSYSLLLGTGQGWENRDDAIALDLWLTLLPTVQEADSSGTKLIINLTFWTFFGHLTN